jgi:hypothetical protein
VLITPLKRSIVAFQKVWTYTLIRS